MKEQDRAPAIGHSHPSPQDADNRRFVLQWHVTERCNLRCRHCYQETYSGPELGFDDLLAIVDQFRDLLRRLGAGQDSHQVRGQINVSGGEPFVRKDFLDLLEVFSDHQPELTFAILTNGTLIDEATAARLGALQPLFVQVSIEGTRETHDAIRGTGAYDQAVHGLRQLVRTGVRAHISFTAHRGNVHEFGDVARLGHDLGVQRVWADRLIPWGSGAELEGDPLSPEETRAFLEIMADARAEAMRSFGRTEIYMARALQFLVAGGTPYRCGAGDTLLTVQPNADLYPCRRLPVRVGNLKETSLSELYFENPFLRALRDHRVSSGCEDCTFARRCRGGLRCLAYAVTGDAFQPDPGCWRVSSTRSGTMPPRSQCCPTCP